MGPGSAPKAGGFSGTSRAGLGRPRAWGRASAPHPTPRVPPLPAEPRLLAADLFDILLPMLNIYQEFVRNHQYSLQILAHCKQNRDFDKLLKHYEAKPDCEERTLETFLTYPMFQVRHPACRPTRVHAHVGGWAVGSGGVRPAESQACRAGQGLGWRGSSHPRPWLQV